MLAERVAAGELPPVGDRLPENPLVVVPLDEIGRYGGTINRALTGEVVQVSGISKTLSENLMGYERPMPNRILYNLAERHEFLDEGRTALFYLRKGLKWSDGHPFTVDDILFWYHDMWVDPDARRSPLFPTQYLVEGEPIEMEKVDDHTIRFRSHKPLGGILHNLSQDYIALPKHVFAPLHPRYNPESTYEALRDATTRAKRILTPGIPRMSPWVPVEWKRDQQVVYERNPYYFKIDSAGNQLPYADRLVFHIIPDRQVILLKFINGELDLFGRYTQINMLPTLRANEPKGDVYPEVRDTDARLGPTPQLGYSASRTQTRVSRQKGASRAFTRAEPGRDRRDRISRHVDSVRFHVRAGQPVLLGSADEGLFRLRS